MIRTHSVLLAILGFLALAGAAAAGDLRWTRYDNGRFGYSIDVPAGLFAMQPAPENNDGRDFAGRDGRSHLVVWGSYNALEQSPAEYAAFFAEDAGYGRVTYKVVKDDWLVLSGFRPSPRSDKPSERIFYMRVMFNRDHSAMSHFEISYEADDKARFDPVVARLVATMTAPADD